MLVIRYVRIGKKNQPYFRIRVTDKLRPAKGGRFVEEVGTWSPLTKQKTLKVERIKYWLSVGAQPSDSVYNLLVSEKVIEGKKRDVHKKSKKKEGTAEMPKAPEAAVAAPAPVVAAAPVAETPKAEESKTPEVETEKPKESIDATQDKAPKEEAPAPAPEPLGHSSVTGEAASIPGKPVEEPKEKPADNPPVAEAPVEPPATSEEKK
ncbi:MAG: 30S ribosomal protein S16 [Patescibacteria group bacterium]